MTVLDILPELITFEEASQALGVSVETIRSYATREENPLPIIMITPRTIRINKLDFIDWIRSNTREGK